MLKLVWNTPFSNKKSSLSQYFRFLMRRPVLCMPVCRQHTGIPETNTIPTAPHVFASCPLLQFGTGYRAVLEPPAAGSRLGRRPD